MKTSTINPFIMKNIVLIALLFSGIVNAQIVTIPDANLKAKLLAADVGNGIAAAGDPYDPTSPAQYIKIDTNSDGEIQVSEALLIQFLNVGGEVNLPASFSNIAALTGIEAFSNLHFLRCMNSQITSESFTNLTNLEDLMLTGAANLTQLNLIGMTNLKRLYLSDCIINSLSITNSPLLTELDLNGNDLTSIAINSYPLLKNLFLSGNLMTQISGFTNLNNLEMLMLANNPALTSIQLPPLPALKYMIIQAAPITTIDLSVCPILENLYINNSQMASIDLSADLLLKEAVLMGNLFTTIDITMLSNLVSFNGAMNQFTTLDFSGNPLLNVIAIDANPDLVSINLKNGSNSTINIGTTGIVTPINLPNLSFICIDEADIINYTSTPLPASVATSSYCTFTPGGDFNTITGTILFDGNNDGCNAADAPHPNIGIHVNDGTNQGFSFTNTGGLYNFYTEAGFFLLNPNIENPGYFTVSPPFAYASFPDANNNSAVVNFCLTANGAHNDLEVVLAPVNNARPGFDANYKVIFKNKGSQTLSGTVTVDFQDAVIDFVSSVPGVDSQVINQLTWNYAALQPFESRVIELTLHINSPIQAPPVNNGDILHFTTIINPQTGDELPSDNTAAYSQTVINSMDPNAKTCLEGDVVAPTEIGKYLHYNIEFENTGTADAVNVVVKDVIDSAKFDINSLQIMYASNEVETKINANVVEFIFKNIHLAPAIGTPPVGGHGSILFKIKTLETLNEGDDVKNTANIYFDYNAPIDTNEARTVFTVLSSAVFHADDSVVAYPNPATDIVRIDCDSVIHSIELYDVQGRLLETVMGENVTKLDISDKTKGVYFMRVSSDKGKKVVKVVKE